MKHGNVEIMWNDTNVAISANHEEPSYCLDSQEGRVEGLSLLCLFHSSFWVCSCHTAGFHLLGLVNLKPMYFFPVTSFFPQEN